MALTLATRAAHEQAAPGPADAGPDGICGIAVDAAARAFGTTPEAVLGSDRHRNVTDARAVAMTAARNNGLTLTVIADYFDKDHTSVMYAGTKVAQNPRLNDSAARIVQTIQQRYTEEVPDQATTPRRGQPSNVLQLAALRTQPPTTAGTAPAGALLAAARTAPPNASSIAR